MMLRHPLPHVRGKLLRQDNSFSANIGVIAQAGAEKKQV